MDTAQSISETPKIPILIIDRNPTLGEKVAEKLGQEFLVIFSSSVKPREDFIFIPYKNNIPSFPNAKYPYILIFYSRKEDFRLLPSLIKKASEDKSRLVFSISIFDLSSELLNKLKKFENDIEVFVYGDLFSNERADYHPKSDLSKIFSHLKGKKSITLSGTGEDSVYPVFFEDAVNTLIKTIFLENKKTYFFCIPREKYSALSLSRLIQKIDPEVSLDFIKKKHKDISPEIPEGTFVLEEGYPLETRLKESRDAFSYINEKKEVKKKRQVSLPEFSLPDRGKFPLFFLLIVIFLPGFIFSFLSLSGLGFLSLTKTYIENGDVAKVSIASRISEKNFQAAEAVAPILALQAYPIGQRERVDKIRKDLESFKNLAFSISQFSSGYDNLKNVFLGNSRDPAKDFREGTGYLKNGLLSFQKVLASGTLPEEYRERIDEFEPTLKYFSNTVDVLPQLLGFEKRKKYLVIFQNNMELRPSGGFIGSYGILDIENGKIDNFLIHDVYDADGQLKGHVEPPYPLRRYLPTAHWYLRDSNFNLDFSKAASDISFFLEAETGQQVDGIIALDVSFLKKILQATGPIEVIDYNEIVTEANVYELTQKNAEENFFPGSTQKKDFLRSLSNALKTRIFEEKDINYLLFAQLAGEAISEKHLLFAFPDKSLQKLFSVNGMSSSLIDEREEREDGFNDFLSVSEANLSVNKVNRYIKRKIHQTVEIDSSGVVTERVSVSLDNQSKKDSPFGGDYKTYIRFVTPQNSGLIGIEIDGQEADVVRAYTDPLDYEASSFRPPQGLEVEQVIESGKKVYGFLVVVPSQETKNITVSYRIFKQVPLDKTTFIYDNWVFKQPGTEEDEYSFSINVPDSFTLLEKEGNLNRSIGDTAFVTPFNEDLKFTYNFGRK